MNRVLIIGGGVSALSSAFCLQKKGFSTTIVAESFTTKTTSAVAGAVWELPPAVCGYPREISFVAMLQDQKRSMVSYKTFFELSSNKQSGVNLYPVNFYFKHEINFDPIEKFKMAEAENKLIDFRHDFCLIKKNGVSPNLGYQDAYSYLTPVIDTDTYLEWLFALVTSDPNTEVFTQKIVGDLCDLESDLLKQFNCNAIVNCTGLGAAQLTGDSVFPVRGGLIYLENDGKHFDKIQEVHCTSLPELSDRDGTFIFILPRGENHLILGGVAEINKTDTNIAPQDYPAFKEILNLCQEFLPVLKNGVISKVQPLRLGLRPFRENGVRLELEADKRIIHNYGHGGAGVILSWGCAEEVTSLVELIL